MADDLPPNCIARGDDMICGADRMLTFAGLVAWVNDKEVGWGPMSDIGHTAEGTAATFHWQDDAVTPSELHMINQGQQLAIAGKKETCRGQAFIAGHLQWVAAFR